MKLNAINYKYKTKNMLRLRFLLIFCVGCVINLMSQEVANSTTDVPIEKNIATPAVSAKAARSLSRHIDNISKKFKEKGLDVKAVRDGQVVLVTIPASDLFAPNETRLKAGAETILAYFKQAVEHPQSYRLVVAVYADDTGDEDYSTELTMERAESVTKGLQRTANVKNDDMNIDSYWFGNSRFVVPNNSVINRAKNRRVEIYIVPEQYIIDASRSS